MHFYFKKKLNIKHNNDRITSWMAKGESSVRPNLCGKSLATVTCMGDSFILPNNC